MNTWTCHCRQIELVQDKAPFACSRCPNCGSALTTHGADFAPKNHEIVPSEEDPHVYAYDDGTGEHRIEGGACRWCNRTVGVLLAHGVKPGRIEPCRE